MSDVIVQIYGIRTVEDARMVVGHGAKHIGVSYGHINHTPGQLTCEQAKEIFEGVQPEAVRIGLTCSTDIDEISEDLHAAMPDVLHYVRAYEPVSDFFLIDTKAPTVGDIGATGLTHDRAIDAAIVAATDVRCIIAGGLDEHNVTEAIHKTKPYGVDSYTHTNYDDERANTLHCKDEAKVIAFCEAARNA